jgi:hypothetical protein
MHSSKIHAERIVAFLLQQWSRERATMLRYTYIACVDFNTKRDVLVTVISHCQNYLELAVLHGQKTAASKLTNRICYCFAPGRFRFLIHNDRLKLNDAMRFCFSLA